MYRHDVLSLSSSRSTIGHLGAMLSHFGSQSRVYELPHAHSCQYSFHRLKTRTLTRTTTFFIFPPSLLLHINSSPKSIPVPRPVSPAFTLRPPNGSGLAAEPLHPPLRLCTHAARNARGWIWPGAMPHILTSLDILSFRLPGLNITADILSHRPVTAAACE